MTNMIDKKICSETSKGRYRGRQGERPSHTAETAEEQNFRNSLEVWMELHLDDIQNLDELLYKFRFATDKNRRKDGHVFHAYLVKEFYEDKGTSKVIAVECNGIEPNTDVDIVLDGDIYIQVWYGKMPVGYAIEDRLMNKIDGPISLDWDEELKPVLKKLEQLPSKTGKGFVVNCVPGIGGPTSPELYNLCSERKCVMEMNPNRGHINVYGKSCFEYCNEARQIARVLNLPPKFILGDWKNVQKQNRNMLEESAYGFSMPYTPYGEIFRMNKNDLRNYVKQNFKHLHCDDLMNLPLECLRICVMREQMLRDRGRQ